MSKYEQDISVILLYLDSIEGLLIQILKGNMDKQIKDAKKSIDKKMNKLVKEDKKRDKKCEHDEKMAKKKTK